MTDPSTLARPRARLRLTSGVVQAAIGLTAILLTVAAQWLARPIDPVFPDELLRDVYVNLQIGTELEPRVLVVDIDEASLRSVGSWPWPRERLADLVETLLGRYESRGVALDIVLPKPSDAGGDMRLGALAQHGPVVMAQSFAYAPEGEVPLRMGRLAGGASPPAPLARHATGYIANHEGWPSLPHVGNIGYIPDADGTLRHVPLLTNFDGKVYPALSLALVNCCAGGPALKLPPGGLMRVNYKRDWNAYTVVSAADILAEAIEVNSAKGRLVMVGSSSLSVGDRVTTPLAANRPGLGVQATMLSTLLDYQQGLTPAPWPGALIACLYALVTVLAANYVFPRKAAVWSVLLLGASSLAWLALAYFVCQHDPDFSPTGPLATNLFLLMFAVPYQWQVTQRRSRHLLDTLRQYVAPEVVAELLKSDLADPLKPRQLDVTTLIADMEGYTSQVEQLPVEEAAALTRDFLNCLTGPVIEQRGTLDKYTGDGLVAFWGAPLPIEYHADLALDAAREILRRVEAMSQARVAMGHQPLRVRIGIESGLAMAGDFGTSFRSIYTAVGDSVNTASRLEQAARDFTHDVIVGAGTVARARRHSFLLLGEKKLRGKEHVTTLYTFDMTMEASKASNAESAHAASPAAMEGAA